MSELKYLELHGDRIAYREAGHGHALLLIHGMAGSSATWRAIIPQLSKKYRVIAPDLLGHGESEKPRGDYSLGAFAVSLRDLLDELGVDSRNGRRAVARRRYRDAVRPPAPGLLRAAGPDRQRWPWPRSEPGAADAVGTRRRVGVARGRTTAGAEPRQQAGVMVGLRGDSARRGPARCGTRIARCRMRGPARRSCGRCAQLWTTAVRPLARSTSFMSRPDCPPC